MTRNRQIYEKTGFCVTLKPLGSMGPMNGHKAVHIFN
jgi:hypothetical protein